MNPLIPSAKTIQIYLPKGNPRGLRLAEMTTRMVRLIEIPRIHIDEFFAMPEANKVGLYFLVGDLDNINKPLLYIGQTGELRRRLEQHNKAKGSWEWERAFVMLLTNDSLTQTHTLYMEHKAIARANEVGRYTLKNGNNGNKPHTPDPLKADCEEWFYTLDILLSTLGQPIFESLSINNKIAYNDENSLNVDNKTTINIETSAIQPEPMLFFCKIQGASARGYYDDDGFVVLAGSLIRKYFSSTLPKSILLLRNNLLSNGTLLSIDENTYKLTENQLFNSPSGAGQMVTGRSSNGWTDWRNDTGQTLDSIYR